MPKVYQYAKSRKVCQKSTGTDAKVLADLTVGSFKEAGQESASHVERLVAGWAPWRGYQEREFCIDNPLVRIHHII